MISLLITAILVLAILAIAWYAISQFNLPPPFRIAIICVFCIVAILFLVRLLPGGSLALG